LGFSANFLVSTVPFSSFFTVKCAEGRQTVDVMNKFCRPKQLNHMAKPPVYNLDIVLKAMTCVSSYLDSFLQNVHRDVANDQTQKSSHSHKTGVSVVIIVHL
jgi:hypothetical protein